MTVNALFDFWRSHVRMQQRRVLNGVLIRAACLEDVVHDAAVVALLAPSTDPAL